MIPAAVISYNGVYGLLVSCIALVPLLVCGTDISPSHHFMEATGTVMDEPNKFTKHLTVSTLVARGVRRLH